MYRRGVLAAAGVAIAPGCTDQLKDRASSLSGPSEEDVKDNAKTIPYDELVRNISKYDGEPVFYPSVRISDFDVNTENRQEFVGVLETSTFGDGKYIWGVWTGSKRYREDDNVDIWAIVDGIKTYMSLTGERTVPRLDIVDMELVE